MYGVHTNPVITAIRILGNYRAVFWTMVVIGEIVNINDFEKLPGNYRGNYPVSGNLGTFGVISNPVICN